MMTSAAKKLDRVRDRAAFAPIPPDLDIDELVNSSSNFIHVSRADARTFNSTERLKEMIQSQVIDGGKPLVLDNWHQTPDWPKWIFKPEWLVDNHGQDPINIRDISSMTDSSFSMGHYLKSLSVLTSKFTKHDYDGKQRLYAKDIDCPPAWQKSLEKILPPSTFYLSSSDLMSHLPVDARAENLMCYFGHEGTYTPAHKEMCASLGQNIMVYTSPGGSSLWFMTASEDRDVVAEYWLGGLGHDIEVESHFASIEALKNAPFTVYIVEQRVGDFILVPPLAPHQVWNRGETTMKVAWNRTTAETLKLAIEESLPKARLVCRDEQYKNKAIIYETLKHYHKVLSREVSRDPDISLSKLKSDFCKLFKLFDKIMLDEHFSPVHERRMEVKKIPNEFNVTCSFCRGNIFNRFLSCKRCVEHPDEDVDEDVYDICMECYARGRSCGCISKLCWEEQHDWNTLVRDHEKFRMQVITIEGSVTETSPKKLAIAFKDIDKKSLAWVCQEQLLIRPFVDVTKDQLEDVDDAKDIERKKKMGLLVNCHVCKVRHPDWKIAKCNACSKAYCYGNLWRAFDIDPFEVLCDAEWKCPFCLGICSCGQCRKNGKMIPYEPKGTMLGASTKHVADPRSVESLVDFSRGNLTWLSENPEPLKRKRSPARTDDGDEITMSFASTYRGYGAIDEEADSYSLHHDEEIPIDPSLVISSDEASNGRGDDYHEPDLDGSGRNGQYINNYPSSVLVGRGSSHQADGKASAVALAKRSIRIPGALERRGNHIDKQPLLPSPKDMLTGALPSRRREGLPHDTQLSHPSSYYSSETRNMFDKPQSKDLRGDIQPYTHQSLSRIDADNQSMWPEMSSLERNPEAFIAAAGLSILAGIESYPGEPSSSSEVIGSHLLGSSSSLLPAAPTNSTAEPSEDPTCYAGGVLHSPLSTRGRDRDEAENTANPFPDDTYNPLAPIMLAKAKRKSNPYGISAATSEIIGVNGTFPLTEPTPSMYELMANDQARKLKRARYIASKGKGRNKKTLVVKLKLGAEGWRKWEERVVEPDMIMEYHMKGGKLHKVVIKKDDIGTGSGEGGKRQRGRPKRTASTASEATSEEDHDDDEEEEGGGEEDKDEDEEEIEPEVIPEPKPRRRESAWIARKRKEEAAEAAEKAVQDAKIARENAIKDAQQRLIDERQMIIDEKRTVEEERVRKEQERLQAIEDEKEERRRAYQEAKVLAAEVAGGTLEDSWGVDGDEETGLQMVEDDSVTQSPDAFWESQLPGSNFAVVIERQSGVNWRTQYATEAELFIEAELTSRGAVKTIRPSLVSIRGGSVERAIRPTPKPTTVVPDVLTSSPAPQSNVHMAKGSGPKIRRVEKSIRTNRPISNSPATLDLASKRGFSPKSNIAARTPSYKSLQGITTSSSRFQPSIQPTTTELEKSAKFKYSSSDSEWGNDDEMWGGDAVNVAKKWRY